MTKETIAAVLKASGLTQKQFALKIGVSISTLRNWLIGKYEPLFVNQKCMRFYFRELFKTAEGR